MKKPFSEIVENLHTNKKTGLLTVTCASEKNLFKFYFKNGEIYHISFGFKKGFYCLDELSQKELLCYNFIPEITIDITSNDIPSTEKVITILKEMAKFVSSDSVATSPDIVKIKEAIKTALIRQIGPIGGKITEKYITEKWTPSNPPTKEDFLNLIDMLKEEIEDASSRKEFLQEVNKILEVYR